MVRGGEGVVRGWWLAHWRPPPKSTVFCQSIALGKGRLGMMSSYGVMSTGTQPAAWLGVGVGVGLGVGVGVRARARARG